MKYILKNEFTAIRKMEDSDFDYNLMLNWISDPMVSKYYGADDTINIEKIINKFRSRIIGENNVTACIIEIQGKPAGYIQYYPIQSEEDYDWKNEITIDFSNKNYGIDLFIAHEDNRNKGFGTELIQLLLSYLFEKENADEVFIDPQTWNKRAIKCYEKCGFKPIKIIKEREINSGVLKDSLIMSIKK